MTGHVYLKSCRGPITHPHTQVEIQVFLCQLALQNASLMSEEALS